jgi:predicted TIM-barrel fold metal-dependent hydrolase
VTRIIDAHVHIFPPDVCARRELYHARDTWFSLLYEDPRLLLASEHDLVSSMDRAGIGVSLACGFPWADPGLCREHNEYMAEACRTYPGRLGFLGIVAPHSPSAVEDAERAFKLGAAGIGELNADAQGFDLREPGTVADLMQLCHDLKKAVTLHSTEPVGHSYPGKGNATPDRIVTWLSAFPAQPVVLAHWGGGLPFYELMPEVRAVTRFVSYDSAATTYLYNHAVFQTVATLVGSDRVLFASDYPILRQDRLARRCGVGIEDPDTLEHIYASNAERVYGLQALEMEQRKP